MSLADSTTPSPTHSPLVKRSLWISYTLLIFGVIFLGWLIYRLDPKTIWSYLKMLKWKCFWLLLPSAASFVLYTRAWNTFLKGNGLRVAFGRLFMMKVSGEAVNMVNPISWGAGDPVRIYLLKRDVPVSQGTASVVVDRTLNAMSEVVFMGIGIIIAFVLFLVEEER